MRELFEMSFEVVKASLPMFFSGLKLTLLYSFFGIAGSIFVGLACSLVKYFKIAVLKRIVSAYVELARNTPLLIQLFFSLLRLSRHWAKNECLNLRYRRLDFSWRSIYGGRF